MFWIGAAIRDLVLNLVISGIPSIQRTEDALHSNVDLVLNLVISGIPSIRIRKCLAW